MNRVLALLPGFFGTSCSILFSHSCARYDSGIRRQIVAVTLAGGQPLGLRQKIVGVWFFIPRRAADMVAFPRRTREQEADPSRRKPPGA